MQHSIFFEHEQLFNACYKPLLDCTSRYLLLYGGRDAAKSWWAAQKLLLETMRQPYYRAVLIRKYYSSIRDSQWQTLVDLINSYGLQSFFHITSSPLSITYKPNGNRIIAKGLDKPDKLKSLKEPTAIWYEEATELSHEDFIKSTFSLRNSKGVPMQEIITFNPELESHWLNEHFFPPRTTYEKADGDFFEVESIRNDTTIRHCTYKHNQFCTPDRIRLLKGLKQQNEELYKVHALGLWGATRRGMIFENWQRSHSFPETERVVYGLDFGFTNDPTALVAIAKTDGMLWAKVLLYDYGLTNQDIAQCLRSLGIGSHDEIIADSAEPKSIEEIYRLGFNIRPAVKGRDSITHDIDLLKRQPIVVVNSPQLESELNSYCWASDLHGKLTNKPVDYNNHAIDALRYGARQLIGSQGNILAWG